MKIGALFAGYGGLDIATERVFGARTAWVSEFDKAPSRILAQRFPDAPNLGDVTKVQWGPDCPHDGAHKVQVFRFGYADDSTAETVYRCVDCGWEIPVDQRPVGVPYPVDIITGGSPCQDLSHAGKRAGMKAGTRSGLWASMCDAIETIRPRFVVWENVRGALSAEATAGDMESCEFCMGDDGRPSLRALGRVLGDLAELGYDAAWCGLRAADVGAPHGRFRVFVLAWDAAADPDGAARGERRLAAPGQAEGGRSRADAGRRGGAPDPEVTLLPTPAVNDMGDGKTLEWWDDWAPRQKSAKGTPAPHGKSLAIEALRLLPTPRATDGTKGGPNQRGSSGDLMMPAAVQAERFGQYADAIARWEATLGRSAPPPTEPTGKGGAHRLSPRFVEWMMGLPDGWVTDVGLSRNEQLKALGNGVVPQQAEAALGHMLDVRSGEIR